MWPLDGSLIRWWSTAKSLESDIRWAKLLPLFKRFPI